MAFVVKGMINRTEVYNDSGSVQVAPYLHNPCGSDYTWIIQDLKTVRGVRKRIQNKVWPADVVELHICSSVNVTCDKYDRLIETLAEGQFKKMNK